MENKNIDKTYKKFSAKKYSLCHALCDKNIASINIKNLVQRSLRSVPLSVIKI